MFLHQALQYLFGPAQLRFGSAFAYAQQFSYLLVRVTFYHIHIKHSAAG